MTAILFFGVIIAWCILSAMFAFSEALADALRQISKNSFLVFLMRIMVFVSLLVLLVADEIIGRQQFLSACSRYAVVEPLPEIRSDRIYSVKSDRADSIDGAVVPLTIIRSVAIDVEDGKKLFRYATIFAKGGWLIRTLGISNSDSPLFYPPICDSRSEVRETKAKFNLKADRD